MHTHWQRETARFVGLGGGVWRWVGAGLITGAVLVGLVVGAGRLSELVAATVEPASWQIVLPERSGGVDSAGPIAVAPPAYGRIERVELYELGSAEPAALPLAPLPPTGGPLARADGQPLLAPGRTYRLVLTGVAFDFGQSWPRPARVTRATTFSTLAPPRPQLPTEPVTLRYGEEIVVAWDQPVRDVAYEVTPPARTRLSVDPADPRKLRLALEEYQGGAHHELTFTRATGANGVALERPYRLAFVTPTFPAATLLRPERGPLPIGMPLEVRWNVPITSFTVQAPPGVQDRPVLDERDPTIGRIELSGLQQGHEYVVVVTGATARDGAPLQRPLELRFQTPPALQIVAVGPEDGATGVRRVANPYVTFSEPVVDRAAAERAFTIEPQVAGRFEWESDTTLVYVTEEPFPYETTVTVRLAGGPEAARTAAGGYLDQAAQFRFTTEQKRVIDVSLTRQMLYLIEGDRVVFSTPVATGVPGADTPIGTYYVQYKMPKAHFRGVNPSGRRYDIPDVPWVLAFLGDYTIHGAPWRTHFGQVGSNGCVSMPTEAAKVVYDWAEVGTPIEIHP